MHRRIVIPFCQNYGVVCGRIQQKLYNNQSELTDRYEMVSGGPSCVMQISAAQFHSLECLESGTVIFEAKDGVYAPLAPEDIWYDK